MSIPLTVVVALVLLAMCYVGNFTLFPVATGQIWGPAHLAANYGIVFIAFGVGALVGPPLSGLAGDAGVVETAFTAGAGILAVGVLLIALLKQPRRRT